MGFLTGTTGSTDVGISDLTMGVSKSGMAKYKEDLKTNVLVKVSDKINDVTTVITAIEAGWQGISRDNFLTDFAAARGSICADLKEEYNDLQARLEELEDSYFRQDASLYELESK